MESPRASVRIEKSPERPQRMSKMSSSRGSFSGTERLSKNPSQTRELSTELNILHKDNQHKEHRIQGLTKEIQSLRITHSNNQREMKSMANTIEILKKEKSQHESERKQSQNKIKELQDLLQQYQEGKQLLEVNQKLTTEIHHFHTTISSLQGEIILKQKEIDQLQEDLAIASLTIQTQNHYENALFYDQLQPTTTAHPIKANLSLSFGKNREVLKSLYFDLSKKTINNQSLSESLAEQRQLIRQLQDEQQQTRLQSDHYREEVTKLRTEKEELIHSLQKITVEKQALEKIVEDQQQSAKQYEQQILEINKRATEFRIQSEQQKHALQYELQQQTLQQKEQENNQQLLLQSKETLQQEYNSLQQQYLQLQEEIRDLQAHLLQAQQLQQEKIILLETMTKRNEQLTKINEQNEMSYQSLQQQCQQYEQEIFTLKGQMNYYQFHDQQAQAVIKEQQIQYSQLQQTYQHLQQEQQEVLTAFQQLLQTSKELKESYQQSQQQIQSLQTQLQQVETIKTNMNQAILNCLFEERKVKQFVTHQFEEESILRQQLETNTSSSYPSPPLPSNLNSRGQLLGYVHVQTPSEVMNNNNASMSDTVMARISRGDFDWLNDDQMIRSLLNESHRELPSLPKHYNLRTSPAEVQELYQKQQQRQQILIPPSVDSRHGYKQDVSNTVSSSRDTHEMRPQQPSEESKVPSPPTNPTESSTTLPEPSRSQSILAEVTRFTEEMTTLPKPSVVSLPPVNSSEKAFIATNSVSSSLPIQETSKAMPTPQTKETPPPPTFISYRSLLPPLPPGEKSPSDQSISNTAVSPAQEHVPPGPENTAGNFRSRTGESVSETKTSAIQNLLNITLASSDNLSLLMKSVSTGSGSQLDKNTNSLNSSRKSSSSSSSSSLSGQALSSNHSESGRNSRSSSQGSIDQLLGGFGRDLPPVSEQASHQPPRSTYTPGDQSATFKNVNNPFFNVSRTENRTLPLEESSEKMNQHYYVETLGNPEEEEEDDLSSINLLELAKFGK